MSRPIVDTTDTSIGTEKTIIQKGPLPKSLDTMTAPIIEPASEIDLRKDRLELERFMNEPVEVLVLEPPEMLGEAWVISVTVNTVQQRIFRGQPQNVKRKYLEVLARARRSGVSATGYKDMTGEAVNEVHKHSRALEYPFQVLSDPSGAKGAAWLHGILREER